jgi:hypothetical protein
MKDNQEILKTSVSKVDKIIKVPKPLSHQKANCISHEETTFEITNKS